MNMRLHYWTLCLMVFIIPLQQHAQTTINLSPRTSSPEAAKLRSIGDIKVHQLGQPNLERERLRDQNNSTNRFSTPLKVDLGWEDGQWEKLSNGDRVWRLQLRSKGALGLAVFYDAFYIPPGASLHMYNEDKSQIIGAYTTANNPANGKFWTGFTDGESAILEYFEPKGVEGQGQLHLFRVDYAYHANNYELAFRNEVAMERGFGAAEACQENINCTTGQAFQDEKRAICRIFMILEEGTIFCTGNLINNTLEDQKPYVLSAFHCQDGFTPQYEFWRFDFNYESADCTNPNSEPGFQSILGCQLRAGRRNNDFLLVELLNPLPNSFNTYFLGWNRSTSAPQGATMIHHPRGDIKKISQSDQAVGIFNRGIMWNNDFTSPAQHHFDVQFGDQTFQEGSSGGALIDNNRRIVGQLHGGVGLGRCDTATLAYFGRLALAWEGGGTADSRLKDWLDPNNSGAMTTDGLEGQRSEGISIGGMAITDAGDPIPNTVVQIFGGDGLALSTVTDAMGNYSFSNLPLNQTYQLSPFKNDDAGEGLSVLDLIQVRKHILNLELLPSPYQIISADVNNSGSISTLDLILMQKVILGIDIGFENVPTWTFLPANATFIDNADPFAGLSTGSFIINLGNNADDINDFDIIGIKAGDINNSADLE